MEVWLTNRNFSKGKLSLIVAAGLQIQKVQHFKYFAISWRYFMNDVDDSIGKNIAYYPGTLFILQNKITYVTATCMIFDISLYSLILVYWTNNTQDQIGSK